MASIGKMKSRWLTDTETNRLAQLIQNYFIKSAYLIIMNRSHGNFVFTESMKEHILRDLELDFLDNDRYPSIYSDQNQAILKNNSQSYNSYSWFDLRSSNTSTMTNSIMLPWLNKNITLIPPMIVETILDISDFPEDEQLYIDSDLISSKKKTEIVLERWLVKLDLNNYDNDSNDIDTIYDQTVALIKQLNLGLGTLPVSNIREHSINKRIKTKIFNGSRSITSKGRYGLSKPLIQYRPENDIVKSKDLQPVITPIGSLLLSVSFRTNCNYHIISGVHEEFTRSSPKDISNPIESIMSNMKFRASNSSLNSQNMKRRPSGRSGSIMRVNSMASSASPPIRKNSLTITSPTQVKKVDSGLSIHFMNSTDRQDSIGSGHGIITPTTGKLPSSYNSRFRNNTSRNNSNDLNTNPLGLNTSNQNQLQTNKTKTKFHPLVTNNQDTFTSIDDDLSTFMRFLDTKPDLRVSNSSLMLYEDSLNNFKNLKRHNDIFNESLLKSTPSVFRSRSISPPLPPPLIGDISNTDFAHFIASNKQSEYKSHQTHSSSSTPMQLSIANNSITSYPPRGQGIAGSLDKEDPILNRVRAASKGSRGSHDSRGSRGSRDSQGSRHGLQLTHAPLVVSSYSPGSIFGTPNANNQSLHSVLKAQPVSVTSTDPIMALNMSKDDQLSNSGQNHPIFAVNSNNSHFTSFSDSKFFNSNRTDMIDYSVNRPISPSTHISHASSLPRQYDQFNPTNSNWNSPPSRAQSLLRSLSIGVGGTSSNVPKSRTGSSGSMSNSNNLKNMLQKSLGYEQPRRNSKLGTVESFKDGSTREITPDQLRDMSYGQQVFDSDNEDAQSINEMGGSNRANSSKKLSNEGKLQKRTSSKEKRESLSNVLNNMRNIQRRRSSVISSAVLQSRVADFGEDSDTNIHSDSQDEDDDLLFEMTDMNSIKP